MKLVLATTNPHKIRELRLLLKPLKYLDLYTLLDYADYIPPEETGTTFEENALLKANQAAKILRIWALGEDSGLVVPVLGGAPGIYSARYTNDGNDKENRKKLLNEMENFTGIERSAYFVCSLALVSPAGLQKTVTGSCEGTIALEEKGRHGFGYDSLFIKHDYQKTFAELEETLKNQISHRAKAMAKMLPILENFATREGGPLLETDELPRLE